MSAQGTTEDGRRRSEIVAAGGPRVEVKKGGWAWAAEGRHWRPSTRQENGPPAAEGRPWGRLNLRGGPEATGGRSSRGPRSTTVGPRRPGVRVWIPAFLETTGGPRHIRDISGSRIPPEGLLWIPVTFPPNVGPGVQAGLAWIPAPRCATGPGHLRWVVDQGCQGHGRHGHVRGDHIRRLGVRD